MANNEEIKSQDTAKQVEQAVEVKPTETKVSDAKTGVLKVDKKKKDKKVKVAKVNGVSKTISEWKKITWPTFKKVVKQTSVVLVVVLAFLLVILGLDKFCSWLFGLICS